MHGAGADAAGWAWGGLRPGWTRAAKALRLLTAALLLGVALLLAGLVGQGVAVADETASSGGLPAAGATEDGVEGDNAALPAASEPGEGTGTDDVAASREAATSVLRQPAPPPPQTAGEDPATGEGSQQPGGDGPGDSTVVPKWGEAWRPQPEGSPPAVTEDGDSDPTDGPREASSQPGEAASMRGVDITLGPSLEPTEVYLVIGGSDRPGAPYAVAIPTQAADATSAQPQPTGSEPTGSEPTGGLVDDLDALEQADRSFGPLDQYPRDDQGVVRLPAVRVTATPTTQPIAPDVPDAVAAAAARGGLLAAVTPEARVQEGDVSSVVGEDAAGLAEPDGTNPAALVGAGRVGSGSPAGAGAASRTADLGLQPPAPAPPLGLVGSVPAATTLTAASSAGQPAGQPRAPGLPAPALAGTAQADTGSRSGGVVAAGGVIEQGARTLPAGPARAGTTFRRVLGALGSLFTPRPAKATHREPHPDDFEEYYYYHYYYYYDAIADVVIGLSAVGLAGGILARVLVGNHPLVRVITVTMALVGAALGLHVFFIANPPATDTAWSAQRFWTIATLGVSVATAVIPILLAASISLPVAVGAGVASGAITAALDYLFWSAVNPQPSSRPKPPVPQPRDRLPTTTPV
jgi:hypothetical protein